MNIKNVHITVILPVATFTAQPKIILDDILATILSTVDRTADVPTTPQV